jgi:vacuolar-type H+-ATPase subunit E/Vma4
MSDSQHENSRTQDQTGSRRGSRGSSNASGGARSRRALIEGIHAEAEEEAEKIRKEAERQAEEIVRGAEQKAEDIRRQAEERAEEQAESIRSAKRQEVEAETRKALLHAKEELFREAMKRLKKRVQELTGDPSYRDVMMGWVVEGALGLEAEELVLNGGARERELADEQFLRDAEEQIEQAGGGRVSLRLSEAEPLGEPGVHIASGNGRTVFNNRLSARLERYGSTLRRMIYRHIEEGAGENEERSREGNE